MIKAVVFGGTTEGRKLCEFCSANGRDILYCTATRDGTIPVAALPHIKTKIGRLGAHDMASLFKQYGPLLVIDATHPYAMEAHQNILDACSKTGTRYVRVKRDMGPETGCSFWDSPDELIPWLERQPGNIFVTTGSSSAAAFTKLTNYQSRIWLRVLPNLNSLETCLSLGYRPERIICMQGPFSEALNRAMFLSAVARILVTKDSGIPGGFAEKIDAAKSLGMAVAVLSRPEETGGIPLNEACDILLGLIK